LWALITELVRPFAAIYSAIFSTHVKITHNNKYQVLYFTFAVLFVVQSMYDGCNNLLSAMVALSFIYAG
jgi:hypothetical protein